MLRKFFLPPLLDCKKYIVLLFATLLIIMLTQAMFLILTGPIMTLLLSAKQTTLQLKQLTPLATNLLPDVNLPRSFFLTWLPIILALTGIIKSTCAFLFRHCQNYISLWLAKHLRQEVFAATVNQPYTVFLQQPTAHWMSIIMNNMFLLQTRFSDIMTCFIRNTAQVCTCIVVLAFIHYPSAIALVILALLLTFILRHLSQHIATFATDYQAKLADISTQVLDLRRRFEFIRSQGGTNLEIQHFDRSSHAYYHAIRRSILIRTGLSPLAEFVGVILFAAIILLINQRLLLTNTTPTIIVQFLVALGMTLKPLRNFTDQLSSLQETRGALQTCLNILTTQQTTPPPTTTTHLAPQDFIIKHIAITYPNEDNDITFTNLPIKFGTVTALIGSSGAGKSSLAKTLAGLITPSQWQCQYDLTTLSQHVSYAGQKPFLFHDTLQDNLCYGLQKNSTTHTRIAYYWNLLKLNKDLNDTFNPLTPELSGGQMQKLTIIRALLRPAPILVLDEITAAIDMAMEQEIITELKHIAQQEQRWILLITHRQQLLPTFNHIWFAQRNQPLLQGKHTELMQQQTAYRNFCHSEKSKSTTNSTINTGNNC